jgi:hypothetical protein
MRSEPGTMEVSLFEIRRGDVRCPSYHGGVKGRSSGETRKNTRGFLEWFRPLEYKTLRPLFLNALGSERVTKLVKSCAYECEGRLKLFFTRQVTVPFYRAKVTSYIVRLMGVLHCKA